ncbi:MAG TPA: hypothetical protein VKG85_08910 [Actinomycetes bacterium]|nr:hypothetical protein [Actinomycetes bacterium]
MSRTKGTQGTQRISDEVWAQLDPAAGRLSRRTARRLWLAAAVVVAAALVFVGIRASGAVAPDLAVIRTVWEINGSEDAGSRPPATGYAVIENRGWTPARILYVTRGPSSPEPVAELAMFYPRLLRPGESAYLPVRVVDDVCAMTAGAAWPITFVVERVGGTRTVSLQAPASDPPCPG